MFNWLKEKLAGDELRRKDETIQHYRDLLRSYEINHEEFKRVKLKAEILEMHLEQGVSIDDSIDAVLKPKLSGYQLAVMYGDQQRAAMLNSQGNALGLTGLNSMLGRGKLN